MLEIEYCLIKKNYETKFDKYFEEHIDLLFIHSAKKNSRIFTLFSDRQVYISPQVIKK